MTAPMTPQAPVHPLIDETMRELFGPGAQGGQQNDPSASNAIAAPNPPEDMADVEPLDRLRSLMAALYGSDFPLLDALDTLRDRAPFDPAMAECERTGTMPPLEMLLAETDADAWAMWVRGRWATHRAAVEMHLYLCARNRLFRNGQQWVSSKGREPWREPSRPTESARVVHNLIGPALDQRIQVMSDQRPGFEIDPNAQTPDERRKAEARQVALEHQFDQQRMDRQMREAAYWAGTDGVAFWHTTWDRDRGPWDTRMGNVPNQAKPLGDLRTLTLRVEQVRVSANATATEDPYYAIVREVLSETEAAYLYGAAGIQERATSGDINGHGDTDNSGSNADGIMPSWVLTQTIVGEGNRLNNIKTVERFFMYVDRHPDVLPEGLQLTVVGNSVVWGPGELLFGTIPIAAFRDGSTDPSYLPRPIMEQWIPPQMRINASLSLWVNSIRGNAGGKLVARPDAISRETFTGAGTSIMELEGAGPISDNIMPLPGFLIGQDVKDLIAFDVKAVEDMSGYNDVSRGQISNETATAVASANEHIERVFSPVVDAAARAYEDWARIQLAGMAWGYDIPRDLGAVGKTRPDLARALSAQDFDGPTTVRVNAAKLVPMPKVYRMQILDNWLDRGLISRDQYMRNVKFASFEQLNSADEDQEARARRVADAIRMGQPLPPVPPVPGDPMADPMLVAQAPMIAAQPLALRWQTNEAIEQNILEREILLQDDLDPKVVMAAGERWKALAQQQQLKQSVMPAPPADPNSPDSPAPGGESAPSPGPQSPSSPMSAAPSPGAPASVPM